MVILRILIALIDAILKVFVDAFVAGGAILMEFLIALALGVVALWVIILLTISAARRVRRR